MVRENHKNIKDIEEIQDIKNVPGDGLEPFGAFFSPLFQALGRRNQPQKRESSPLGKKSASGAEKNQKKRRRGWKQAKNPPEKSAPGEEKCPGGGKNLKKIEMSKTP